MSTRDGARTQDHITRDSRAPQVERIGLIATMGLGFTALNHPVLLPLLMLAVIAVAAAFLIRVQRTGVLNWPWSRRASATATQPRQHWTLIGLVFIALTLPVVAVFVLTDRLTTASPAVILSVAGIALTLGFRS